MLWRWLPAALAAALLTLVAGGLRANEDPSPYNLGKQALGDERYDDAVTLFGDALRQSQDAVARWRSLLGLAVAHDLADRAVEAARHYRAFLSASEDHPAAAEAKWQTRRSEATADLERLDERALGTHGIVELASVPPNAVVVSTTHVPIELRTPAVLYLPAGAHTIRLRKDGFEDIEHVVVVAVGSRKSHSTTLAPEPAIAATTTPAVPAAAPPAPIAERPPIAPVPDTPADAAWLQAAGIAAVAAGGCALAAAAILTGLTASAVSELEDLHMGPATDDARMRDAELRDQITSLTTGYVSLYIVGGVLSGGGAALLVYDAQF